ncbi:bifunctional diaminohydroxyphosphoribosylaminopyrimidine deaminase/5-amino-6-(5-phosphoribosylamino)uracil reductase RibD [Actinomyces gaoshouyii]|uniref:Riboflavin biosynthesis protein RibD n=1 Tax=Actinomyces gaoshouyii TaxID=1960083 RepID=A0A8H9H6S6_9ACTO|nr:bifunctional diaminohydroxyphosphoribosylaminopyrimidine deaminase/5-amino-6-(5-phosphoribosylamino)uracil reductase RibD [Actinomyces gaoshouyii]GGO95235.1 riboflavin biosynthesis protein RibD [Actinomyces gaoshouyii]
MRGGNPRESTWTRAESEAMSAALEAARQGPRGANPLVGAAILIDGRIIAVGHHRGAGTPHAEVDAIDAARHAGADFSRAELLVTLEPCGHTGRTPPCAQAIIDAGIPRVIHAIDDPNPTASGGAAALRAAGVEVRSGLLAPEATVLNSRWLECARARRPFVTAKTAMTLDGRIAAADGTSQWITGPAARASGHDLRARAGAILVGSGTLAADNPRLTARVGSGASSASTSPIHQPLRCVMGLRPVPSDAALRADDHWLHLPTRDPREALAVLAERGIGHVLIEGGATVLTAFLAADLVDELIVHIAPLLLGSGRGAVGDLGIATLAGAHRFQPDCPPVLLGDDIVIRCTASPRAH